MVSNLKCYLIIIIIIIEICLSGNGFSKKEIDLSFMDAKEKDEGEAEEGKEKESENEEIVKKGVKVTIKDPHPDLIEEGFFFLLDFPSYFFFHPF